MSKFLLAVLNEEDRLRLVPYRESALALVERREKIAEAQKALDGHRQSVDDHEASLRKALASFGIKAEVGQVFPVLGEKGALEGFEFK